MNTKRSVYKSKALRLLFIALFVTVILSAFVFSASAATYSGTCGADGDNLTWILDTETGVLEISGTGAMKNYSSDNTPWYSYRGNIKSVKINEGVTTVGSYAFYGYNNRYPYLTKVELADTITVIYSCSFENLQLTSIDFPDNLLTINSYAFTNCTNLTELNFPDSLTKVESSAFSGCSKLTSVNFTKNITDLDICFSNCPSLVSFSVDENNKNFCSVDGMVLDKNKEKLIMAPSGLVDVCIPEGVKIIGNSAFYSSPKTKSITMPNSITQIENSAFYNCSALVTVKLSNNLKTIGKSAFSNCTSLKNIEIPDGVTTIEGYTFNYCTELSSVTIPDSVTTIGERAFFGCSKINTLVLGKGIKEIGVRAFQYYNSGHVYTRIPVKNVYYTGSIENWCKINFRTEYSNASGTTPPGPQFTNLYVAGELLETLVIPNGTTSISAYQFYGVSCIKTVILPKSVTSIGTNAFYGVYPKKVIYSGTIKDWCNISFSGGFYTWEDRIEANPVKSSTELYIDGKLITDIEIPSGTTAIKWMTFYNNDKIRNIYIPKTVKSVQSYAFYSCNNLTDVYYEGSQTEWNSISKGQYIDSLLNANIHYNSSPDDFSYKINFYSAIPSLTVNVGYKIPAAVQLTYHGEAVSENFDFSVISSNSDIISVSDFEKEENMLYFKFTAKKQGDVILTVTEHNSGEVYTVPINVVSDTLVFNSDYLPSYKQANQEYNAYTSGMYIADFSQTTNEDGSYNVTFDVYNTYSLMGVVNVYNEFGNILEVEPVDKLTTMPTSIFETVLSSGNLLFELNPFDFELFTFKQDSYAKKTHIEVTVPAGGRIEITNNPFTDDYCSTLNLIGLIFEYACTTADVLTDLGGGFEALENNTIKDILTNVLNSSPKIIKDFKSLLYKHTFKDLSFSTLNQLLSDAAEDCLQVINMNGIDIASWFGKAGVDIVEKVFTGSIGGYGFILNLMFDYSKFINTACWEISIFTENSNKGFSISFDRFGKLSGNGVSVTPENPAASLSDLNFVMHSFVISDDAELPFNFNDTVGQLSDKYVVRNIYLERDGEISQPGQNVQVAIPVPTDYDADKCAVFWITEDGELKDQKAVYKDGYMIFTTDHFSYYALVEIHTHSYKETEKVLTTCTQNGYTLFTCECGDSYTQTEFASGHNFDANMLCSVCSYNAAENCECICHTTNQFIAFIYRIVNFFWKLFRINPTCECGALHY
ncbi:MAG: leucine-rich repeat domain-containing protein [Clostridia bacterium]|nr:leucine-rich repeat domain-containing protein [Clostridia bacterium]